MDSHFRDICRWSMYGWGMGRAAMREPTFLMLAALAEGPKHGYGVMRAVSESSAGRVELKAGTLYAALDRLVGEGLVRVSGEEVVEGRLRRYYDLTDAGVDALGQEAQRLAANARAATRALRARGVLA
ncbi:PadR family transcriptional regulator [Phycicoccus ginsengisoli]